MSGVVVSDLNKNFGGSTALAKKMHGAVDLHTPIHPLQKMSWMLTRHSQMETHKNKAGWYLEKDKNVVKYKPKGT